MFGHIPETQYDLRFRIFAFPVRVHPAFFLVGMLFGWRPEVARMIGLNPLVLALIWTACIFVSILIHELGHAAMAYRFGWRSDIILYHFGGLARFVPTWGNSRNKQIAIALAGPGAGFVFYGIIKLFEFVSDRQGFHIPVLGRLVLYDLEWVNLWWGLVNLLPVYPLDGGQVAMQFLSDRDPRRGMERTLELGVVVGILVAVGAAIYYQRQGIDYWYPSILFGILAANNYQMLQQYRGGGYW